MGIPNTKAVETTFDPESPYSGGKPLDVDDAAREMQDPEQDDWPDDEYQD